MKLTLEDMIPKRSSFQLACSGDHEWVLRPLNAEDKMWIISTFGGQKEIEDIFDKQDWTALCRIAYRLLEDKSELKAAKIIETDEDGEDREILLTGPRRLQRLIIGIKDQSNVLTAILETIGLSEKIMLMLTQDEAGKKKVVEQMVENQERARAGVKSSTRSQASTGGHTKKSAKRRSKKSTSQ